MNVTYKYVLLLTACLGFGFLSNAQEQKPKFSESEIVMTKPELDSFLTNIAEKRRAQIAKRNAELKVNQEFNNALQSKENSVNPDERMYREFDRINQRIDMLMMNAGNRTNTYVTPPMQAPLQQQTPTVIYQQPPLQQFQPQQQVQQPGNRYRGTFNEDLEPAQPAGPSEETLALQRKVNTLKEEVRVLTLLSNNKKDGEYDEEINGLKSKIDQLNTEVERKNQSIHQNSVVYIKANDSLKKGLANYRQDIFYANNSTAISNADKVKLDEVVAIVKTNNPRVTVMVQGYASKKGNARTNSQLSFNRAEAVKQYLLSKGLSARNIITMYHGVDQGTNEAHARRTEVSLLVE
ncbi:MAG: OmpA family protein [Chitinophagaceae bacterium]